MKRKTKRVLGSLGLLAVIAVTAFAAVLPAPGTSATSSVTDTITVRVVSGNPEVNINWLDAGTQTIENGETTVYPQISIEIDYSAVKEAELSVYYKSLTGGEREDVVFRRDVNYAVGTEIVNLNLHEMTGLDGGISRAIKEQNVTSSEQKLVDVSSVAMAEQANYAVSSSKEANFRLAGSESEIPFGYGRYTFTLRGYGEDGTPAAPSSITFNYLPGKADVVENADGSYTLQLEYNYDDGTPAIPQGVAKVVISVYDEDGNLVWGPITKNQEEKTIELPFKKGDHEENYIVEVGFYGRNATKPLIDPIEIEVVGVEVPNTGGETGGSTGNPDTGRFLGKLNIAKVDYLVTGLIIFGIVVIAGIVFVMKGGKNKAKARRK